MAAIKEFTDNDPGERVCSFLLIMKEADKSFAWDVLLFLTLKNFLAFSSSSQLLAGDQIMDGFDDNEAIKDVGVLGLISYDGDEGGDRRELLSTLFKYTGDGVRLVHKSNGISSTGFLGTVRQVPFPAIDDIILDNIRGEMWVAGEEASWGMLSVEILAG